jgi:subtilisin family serine protease
MTTYPLEQIPVIVEMNPATAPFSSGSNMTLANQAVSILNANGHAFGALSIIQGAAGVATSAGITAMSLLPQVATIEEDSVVRPTRPANAGPTYPPGQLTSLYPQETNATKVWKAGGTGRGVTVAVLDSGVDQTHPDLAGREIAEQNFSEAPDATDNYGHGTHVASTVGGATYGVAKGVSLVAVRVLDCDGSGSLSGVVAGVDWAVENHAAGVPAVANMSLGGGTSTALDEAVGRLIADGVTVAAAAGNASADACSESPARVPAAVTVAASSSADAYAGFSNDGPCVDVIAPGVEVTAAWHTSPSATETVSGTSMASPHAAGAAAKFLEGSPGADPATVAATITDEASVDKVSGVSPGTPNRLLYTAR